MKTVMKNGENSEDTGDKYINSLILLENYQTINSTSILINLTASADSVSVVSQLDK